MSKLESQRETEFSEIELLHQKADKGVAKECQEQEVTSWQQISRTACLCGSMFTWGWLASSMGPNFPDLRLIIDKDLKTASWMFTALSLGALVGALMGGMAYDRLSKGRLFIVLHCCLSISVVIIPWCTNFAAMIVVLVVTGVFGIMIDIGATADIVTVWKQKADVYMQLLHSMFCVGAIISPFVTKPFLAQKVQPDLYHSDVYENMLTNVSTTSSSIIVPFTSSKPEINVVYSGEANYGKLEVHKSQTGNEEHVYGETSVYMFYFITAGVCLVTTIAYVIVNYKYGFTSASTKNNVKEKKSYSVLSRRITIVFIVISVINLAFYSLSERIFPQFLMTFLISSLNWSKNSGSDITSVFWIAITTGRLLSVFIVRVISLRILLISAQLLLLVGGIIFWMAIRFSISALVWIAVAVVGLAMAPIFSGILTWVAQNITKLTGRLTSVFFVCASIGTLTYPLLLGYLMEALTYDWFIYFELIVMVCMNIVMVINFVSFKLVKASAKPRGKEFDVNAY